MGANIGVALEGDGFAFLWLKEASEICSGKKIREKILWEISGAFKKFSFPAIFLLSVTLNHHTKNHK